MKRRIAIAVATVAFSVGLQISTFQNNYISAALFVAAATIVVWPYLRLGRLFGWVPFGVYRKRRGTVWRGVVESEGVQWRYVDEDTRGARIAPFCGEHLNAYVFRSNAHGNWVAAVEPYHVIASAECPPDKKVPHGLLWCGANGGHGVTLAEDPRLYEHAWRIARAMVTARVAQEAN